MPYSETTWGYAKDTTSLDKWNDVLISYAGNTITTDAIGNTLWDGLFSYTWQHGRQLARAQNSIIDATYSYNADGIRTSKTVKNTISNTNILHTYDLSGSSIVRECIYDTTGSYVETELRYYYDAKGAPVAMRAFKHDENGALLKDITCYFATNLQGDVVALYDETGNRIASYTYDAWGNNIYKNSTATSNISASDAQWLMNINPFRYRGYYYDTDTGLYYLQSRYYNPYWGRFINADVYINANGDLIGFNMYAYCSNNPVMYVDPQGKALEDIDWENLSFWERRFWELMCFFDSFYFNAGIGVGFSKAVEIDGLSIESTLHRISICLKKDSGESATLATEEETALNVSALFCNFISGFKNTCEMDGSEYKETYYPTFQPQIGYKVSSYFILGAHLEFGIDLDNYAQKRFGSGIALE